MTEHDLTRGCHRPVQDDAPAPGLINEGSLTAATGPINDAPSFAPGLTPTAVKVQRETERTRTVTPQADGSYRLSDNENLSPGNAIRYTVTFTVNIDPSAAGYGEDLLSCTAHNGRLVAGHGLYNKVVPEAGKDSDTRPDHDAACANVSPDAGKRVLSIIKTGSQGPLDDAAFASTRWTPPPRAQAPDRRRHLHRRQGHRNLHHDGPGPQPRVLAGGDQGPAGHQLMARPARFKVTESGIELITPDPGGSALTVSRSGASRSDDTITVRDVQVGTLPLSGGRGIGINVVVGIAAVTGGVLLALRSRKASSSRRSA